MAAERKLKAEIERTLKKVLEGQELFEDLWQQVHETDNNNQREKLEGELKKEIKKLQRLREQIKAWIAGADIKDKQPLMDARKSIERDMERFKACEKEAKIKGINRVHINDPKEKAKEDARDWINSTVDALTSKVEESEYEMEELQGNIKKKQKPPPRLLELEELVNRHKEHIVRLEKVLRCIDNEAIAPEELEDIKADMELYLNPEEGAGMDFSNVDDMYAMLMDRLEAVEAAAPATVVTHGKHTTKGKEKEEAEKEREREKEREKERAAAAAAKAQLIAQGNTSVKLDEDDSTRKGPGAAAGLSGKPPPPPPPAPSTARAVPGTPTKDGAADGTFSSGLATPSGVPGTPRSASISAAAQLPTTPTASTEPPSPAASARSSVVGITAAPGFSTPGGTARPPAPPPGSNYLSATTGSQGSIDQFPPVGAEVRPGAPPAPAAPAAAAPAPGAAAPLSAAVGPAAASSQPAAAAAQQKNFMAKLQQNAPAQAPVGSGAPGAAAAAAAGASKQAGPAGAAGKGFPPGMTPSGPLNYMLSKAAEAAGKGADGALSQSVGDDDKRSTDSAADMLSQMAVKSLSLDASERDAGALRAAGPSTHATPVPEITVQPVVPPFSIQAAKQILEACHSRSLPQMSDLEWKRYKPRHPANVPASYPRVPHEVIDNPALFRKVDPECLFFAFYFQPETYQQYLAAHELKRQSWRFHKHHNAWFQRFTEPTVTSDEFEQGAYVYFDYNIVHDDLQTGWCYRRKENFTFRYDALEDELRVQQAL
mmetsp:Transcript_4548/g.9783  ORF Transcript_4548/g.9783 Transcript_4548/m.9783 type:complete len:769 (-) Transcript_4548:780-3086(-)